MHWKKRGSWTNHKPQACTPSTGITNPQPQNWLAKHALATLIGSAAQESHADCMHGSNRQTHAGCRRCQAKPAGMAQQCNQRQQGIGSRSLDPACDKQSLMQVAVTATENEVLVHHMHALMRWTRHACMHVELCTGPRTTTATFVHRLWAGLASRPLTRQPSCCRTTAFRPHDAPPGRAV